MSNREAIVRAVCIVRSRAEVTEPASVRSSAAVAYGETMVSLRHQMWHQFHRSNQVMCERDPEHPRVDFHEPAHEQAVQCAMRPGVGIHPLGRRCPGLIEGL